MNSALISQWLSSVLQQAPAWVRLLCIEWNDGWIESQEVLVFHACGSKWVNFDPEDPDALISLSEPEWEHENSLGIPAVPDRDETTIVETFRTLLAVNRSSISKFCQRGGRIAYGRHEGHVDVFPKPELPTHSTCFYELSVARRDNSIESKGMEHFDELTAMDIIEKREIKERFPASATFHLQPRGRILDLLWAVRHLVCSERMRDLIVSSTDHCQVFPVNLFRSPTQSENDRIPGYSIVHIFDVLECLDPRTVIPPRYPGALPTFDYSLGYRILRKMVGGRGTFHIAYEHRRLLVSHEFRLRCEKLGITGATWLRRESV